jgi:hypothetical protein
LDVGGIRFVETFLENGLNYLSIMTQSLPFYLTPEDLEVLSMTDEEYTPLSWEFIKDVIGIYT